MEYQSILSGFALPDYMLCSLVYDGPRPQNVEEFENRTEQAVIDITSRCSVQLIKLFESMSVRIARIFEKKGKRIFIELFPVFFHGRPKRFDMFCVNELESLVLELSKKF